MSEALSPDIADFTRRDFTFEGKTKPVLCLGDTGPAVIVIHELFGFTPALARLCRWIADAGMRVYAPILLRKPDASNPERIGLGEVLRLCVSREFTMFRTGRSSPVVDWLKPLARSAHDECGGPGVGVIGMCLTGGFALSMAVDPVILAPILSQPSMPVGRHGALDISAADLEIVRQRTRDEGLTLRGYRFAGDSLSRDEKFVALNQAFGTAFCGTVLPDSAGNPGGTLSEGKPPHSVLTRDLIDAAGQPTRQAVDEIIAHFQAILAA